MPSLTRASLSQPPTQHQPWLDYLRIAAVVAVIVIHAAGPHFFSFGHISDGEWLGLTLVHAMCRPAVPLLVMISGALLLAQVTPLAEFYRRRLPRLFWALSVWSLVFLIEDLMQGASLTEVAHKALIGFWLQGDVIYHLWFLPMFITLMLFAPFLARFVNGQPPSARELSWLLLLLGGLMVMNQASKILVVAGGKPVTWFTQFGWFIGYFVAGHLLCRHPLRLPPAGWLGLMAVALALGVSGNYWLVSQFGVGRDNPLMGSSGPLVLVLALAIFGLVRQYLVDLPASPRVSALASASFGVYLIHPLFLTPLNSWQPMWPGPAAWRMALVICACSCLSFASILLLRRWAWFRRIS